MDTYEATKIVMSRIQSLEPENASRIMGYILIQDQGEKEIIRLAFCPEPVLLSYIKQAQTRLGLHSNSSTPSSNPLSYKPFPQFSPRSITIPNNGFHNLSNPSSPAAAAAAAFQRSRTTRPVLSSSPRSLHFYGGDDFEDQLPFLDDDQVVDPLMSPGGGNDSLVFPYGEDMCGGGGGHSPHHHHPFHRRSCSVNDAAFLEEGGGNGGGFGWRPCMYFERGFCKNGGNCKFLHHGDIGGVETIDLGSPMSNSASGFDELLRMKAIQQQQRFAAMAAAAGGGHHPFSYNKCIDSMNENPRSDYSSMMGFGASSSVARQIYLTFPADSTFKEEDVSNYFGMFGPVQDVRIPYQQKRMFGFVTFVYPETVKAILAKGNPHFVCDSRVLVKPYKEKGKVRDKRQHHHQHQQSERGEYSSCLSPSGENFDLSFGSRMLMSPQEMMLRRKLEQEAELQHAIEIQGRRMMNLQLMDLKNENLNFRYPQMLPAGIQYSSSPTQSQLFMNQHITTSSDSINQENPEEFDISEKRDDEKSVQERSESHTNDINADDPDPHESLDHALPDNLFASPTKSAAGNTTPLTITSSNDTPLLPNSSPLTIASLKSCYLQMPRFSSGQEAIEM